MNETWAKLIPTAAMIAIIGYLSMPYFDAPPANTAPPAKRIKLVVDDLLPTAPPVTERDPFGGSVRFEMGDPQSQQSAQITKGNRAAAGKAAQASPGTRGNTAGQTNDTKTAGGKTADGKNTTGRTAAGNPAKSSVKEVKTADRDVTSDFVLSATLLFGGHQHAIINGRSYQTGDKLDESDAKASCTVAEIHHHYVVLEREGNRLALNYPKESAVPKPGRAGNAKVGRAPAAGAPRGPSPPPRSNVTGQTPARKGAAP